MSELEEKIAKLPLWAREHIGNLTRSRDRAASSLKAFIDTQTVSNLSIIRHNDCPDIGGVHVRSYIQSDSVTFQLGPEDRHYDHIKISFRRNHNNVPYLDVNAQGGSIAVRPTSSNAIELFIPKRE